MSTLVSATIGKSLDTQSGWRRERPWRWVYRASSGCTATATSPSIVSRRVVATTTSPSNSHQRSNGELQLTRDAGYMQICDCMCDLIFCQNPHITFFPAYNGIFRIAYPKIMLHMQKFAYTPPNSAYVITFFSIFLFQCCFKTAKYFGGKRLVVFTIRRWINWSRKCQNCAEKAY